MINKVIIWGYPLHSHTHSYIHYGWVKGFKHLGYDTYWFHDNEYKDKDEFDYENCLFITEGYADKNIPILESSIYFVHMCVNPLKYKKPGCRLIDIRFNVDEIKDCNYNYSLKKYKEQNRTETISNASYYQKINNLHDLRGKENDNTKIEYEALYTMWATDLLPEEFCYNDIEMDREDAFIYYFGSVSNANYINLMSFINEAKKNKVTFIYNDPWKVPKSFEDNRKFIQESVIAPDIRGSGDINKIKLNETGTCHKQIGYIPCRIFKHISYGCLGITNSEHVYNLLEKKVIYSHNEAELFHLGMKERNNYKLIREQMDIVKEHHTYLNRINDILEVIKRPTS